jgi:hypothetical protein
VSTTTVSPSGAARTWVSARWNAQACWIWAFTLALLLYLGLEGGGYDLVIRSTAGIVVWWALLVSAAAGLASISATTRFARVAILLFALFAAWSAASTIWSLSTERSLDEASRLVAYLGVLWLGATTFGPRDQAIRHVVGAVAVGITVIGALALLARFEPNLIPSAATTGQVLHATRSRLSWPLNYWNALGALMAFACPLLLAVATSARQIAIRCGAAAGAPIIVLCAYLTFSRGAEYAGAVAGVVFLLLAPQRIPRLLTALLWAAAGAVLIAAAADRHALENGLGGTQAAHQGTSLMILTIVVCLATAFCQLLLSIVVARADRRGLFTVPLRPARIGTVILVLVIIFASVVAHVPHHLVHAWNGFKSAEAASSSLHHNTPGRFLALSGEGRYTFWKTGIDALGGRWPRGFGLGTFQLVWLPRTHTYTPIINAHSLYVETLIEVGAIGLALLISFLATVLAGAARIVATTDTAARSLGAAIIAAMIGFVINAGFDWIWQVPVEPVCFLLLAAAVLSPGPRSAAAESTRAGLRLLSRGATLAVAVGCLILMGIPMAMTQAVRRSQADANAGRPADAVVAARTALNIEPGSSSAALQVALSLELERQYAEAVQYAQKATSDDPSRWDAWLVQSRLEAEAGRRSQSVEAYIRARGLNPRSPLFKK